MDKYSINRYARQIAIPEIGTHGQKRIAQSSVLIVGIGGLGCPVGLYLAAAGVGKIGLVDNDIVSLSNLQRQILFVDEHIGHPKVHIAQQILIKHNPNLHIDTFQTFLNEENASTLIEPYDLVIDCCDNFATRYIIDKTCKHLQKNWIHGAVERFEGRVALFTPNSLSFSELFPDLSTTQKANGEILGAIPGIVGSLQASMALLLLAKINNANKSRISTININPFNINTIYL